MTVSRRWAAILRGIGNLVAQARRQHDVHVLGAACVLNDYVHGKAHRGRRRHTLKICSWRLCWASGGGDCWESEMEDEKEREAEETEKEEKEGGKGRRGWKGERETEE